VKNTNRNLNVLEPFRTLVNSMSPESYYEVSYDQGKHWKDVDRYGAVSKVSSFWLSPSDVLEEVDQGNVMSYKSFRIRRKNMQGD